MTFDAHQLDLFLLVGSAVTLAAILAVRASSRAGLPSLLVYLLMGVLLGERGLGIHFEDAELAHALGFGALVLILAEGGLTTNWREIKPSMRLGVMLATVGVSISVGIVAVGAHYLLGMDWKLAILLGAATSATDAAAVFSVLRAVPLPRRLTGVLEAESGLNDAPVVVLVVLVSSGAAAEDGPLLMLALILFELVVGVLIGLAVGVGGAWVMRRAALPSSGLYPIAVLVLTLLAYGAGAAVHASGFAAVYVAALVLGNSELPHRAATRSFSEGIAWIAQIGLFVMLGLLLSPDRLTWEVVGLALTAGLLLTFVARPISVLISSLVQPMPWRELGFISWAGLRGAVPIVFTTIPLADGIDGAEKLFDIVFVMVVVYTLLTGPTLPLVARVLRVARRSEPRELELEAAPLERVAADLLQITISPASRMHGVEVGELRLPVGASVSMIVRGETTLVPERRTVLRHGDDLLVVTPRRLRWKTEDRLREVSLGGRLAQWLPEEKAD
ncbi:potassium/proton antiporter [Nocardioides lianchengensis]|uniref:Cell volume regulation protein A n=1 Tax=Nocardioides lianchengensis TaxID=1045774 RepID=A0A1G6Q790_9ACTN|nr:potassium/proton antiporter [Nocardioides lianchengensis]NYG12099.1 cell volume regulation protein A [Nocardioides lianchengensis]SDC87507.1 cell volume regulation protein A [Nocardioides lianchengensis]